METNWSPILDSDFIDMIFVMKFFIYITIFWFIVWLDLRTQSTVETLGKRIPGNNNFVKVRNLFKSIL